MTRDEHAKSTFSYFSENEMKLDDNTFVVT